MIKITIQRDDTTNPETILTDGFLLLLMENDKIKMKGQMSMQALAPILTKLVLEKMVK